MSKMHDTFFKSRIAPTPSGFLHIGNAYSFLLTWLWTRLNNGQLLLRIDDMDGERCRDEYLQDIFDTIQFLGIDYDEGPKNIIDFNQNFTQIKRLENYNAAIEILKGQKKLYACICSRKDMHTNFYLVDPLNCKNKKIPFDTTNSALRINLQHNASIIFQDVLKGEMNINLSTTMPDFIIQQKNKLPSYQICSLVDDLQFGITHIVRGEDLLPSTAAQLYLANLLGEERFKQIHFLHHPLVKTNNDNKLSKSAGDTSIKYMRSNGFTAKQVLKQIIEMFGMKNCEAENIQALLQFIIANDGEEIGIFATLK
jgi:glutamyl/glutaminyl-tRNA synthetase